MLTQCNKRVNSAKKLYVAYNVLGEVSNNHRKIVDDYMRSAFNDES